MTPAVHWRDAPHADFAVIGDPVEHSLSPRMQNAALRELATPYRYVAIHVLAGEVPTALDHLLQLGYRGVNVTVPHKSTVIDWLESVDDFAREARAVNTIRMSNRSGINTDGDGFLDTLAELGLRPPGTVLLLGAGGSARALALALGRQGFRLNVYNRTRARAEELVHNLGIGGQVVDAPDPTDAMLILNTTSSSLAGESLPIAWDNARPDAIAYDLMYGDSAQPFLNEARRRGLGAVDGLGLLVAQGARSLEWWLGVSAPRKAMREALA